MNQFGEFQIGELFQDLFQCGWGKMKFWAFIKGALKTIISDFHGWVKNIKKQKHCEQNVKKSTSHLLRGLQEERQKKEWFQCFFHLNRFCEFQIGDLFQDFFQCWWGKNKREWLLEVLHYSRRSPLDYYFRLSWMSQEYKETKTLWAECKKINIASA